MADHLDHPDQHQARRRGLVLGVTRPGFRATRVALDVLLPTQCLACDALVSEPGTLRHACWDGAAFVYNDVSRNLATGLKYRDRTHAAPALGNWLGRAGRELVGSADLIAPVPLHRARLWRRRFNQSALLAQAVAKHRARAGADERAHEPGLCFDLLTRVRATPS